MRSIPIRIFLLVTVILVGLALLLPSTKYKGLLPDTWTENASKIVLGLDLQGGVHMVVKVDLDEAVGNYTDRTINALQASLKEESVPFSNIEKKGNSSISIGFPFERARNEVISHINDNYSNFSEVTVDGFNVTVSLNDSEVKTIRDLAVIQSLETIRNRIDSKGVAEPIVQKQGYDEILIQLPGVENVEGIKDLIKSVAVLHFKIVDDSVNPYDAERIGPPFGSELIYITDVDEATGEVSREPIVVKSPVLLSGDMLKDARTAFDPMTNEPYVSLSFDSNGAKIFEQLTSQNIGKRLAIILDGQGKSAPVIRDRIGGGNASISGGFDLKEATDLAVVLRSGALAASVEIIQSVTVGPSLGADSIKAGLNAIMIGGVFVLVFMVFYYRVSGIIADFAVMLNLVLLMGIMSWLGATLTLPGIAGIILTIGMGVDSNVLIFERIKEELRLGHHVRDAIDSGYERALKTIVDSNVTTLITAIILFEIGSGPVKGFAVTLFWGILINLFTALVGTKVIFDIQTEKFNIKKLSI